MQYIVFFSDEWKLIVAIWRGLMIYSLIPPVTIVTLKKVFIYKALKTLLTDVLVTSCKYGNNKGSKLNMCSFTWLIQIVTWPEQNLTASKLWNKRLLKCVNIKIWQWFLVHIIFRVSSINICICIYSVLLSVVIEWVNMLMVTIVTAGII